MTWFLNDNVRQEVLSDPTLKAMWVVTRNQYDSEIDALHNPSWVKWAQNREVAHLDYLKQHFKHLETIS